MQKDKKFLFFRTGPCFCSFNTAKVRLTVNLLGIFHKPLLPSKQLTKLNKFGIIGKLLPSRASLYTIPLIKEIYLYKITMIFLFFFFLTFYLKGLQSGFFVTKSFNSFSLLIDNFCLKPQVISKASNVKLGTVGTFFMFIKTR